MIIEDKKKRRGEFNCRLRLIKRKEKDSISKNEWRKKEEWKNRD